MDDLEDSLKRLFRDSRLDVQVAPDADSAVVSGARRVRRRRVAMISTAGVMSLAVLAGGTFLLARPATQQNEVANQPTDLPLVTTTESSPATQESPQETTTRPSPATTTTTQTPDIPPSSRPGQTPGAPTAVVALGPTGYGTFRLGMTEAQVAASSEVQSEPLNGTPSCVRYQARGSTGTPILTVSKRYGLVAITVTGNAQTAEGITIGATEQQVLATYRATITVTVPDNRNANYEFRYTDGKASEITLAAKTQDCG